MMPTLDRRITVCIDAPTSRNVYGEIERGALTELELWAALAIIAAPYSTVAGRTRRWTVRYRSELLVIPKAASVIDEGKTYKVTAIREVAGEREELQGWIEIDGVKADPKIFIPMMMVARVAGRLGWFVWLIIFFYTATFLKECNESVKTWPF